MAKLYPPFIESKLPAFANVLTIPFTMNRSVSIKDVVGVSAVIKTAQTGRQIGILTSTTPTYNATTGKYIASFAGVEDLPLQVGQYYKVQLAFISNNAGERVVGYYSSVGIIKKTSIPTLTIPTLEGKLFNSYDHTGKYSQYRQDESEKVYSYRFDLRDMSGNIIDTSGEQLHDSSTDEYSYESIDSWKSNIELANEVPYFLTYTVTTTNGLTHSIERQMIATESIDIDLDIAIESRLDYEDGAIQLYLMPSDQILSEGASAVNVTGNFILVRSSSINNFNSWDEVYRFSYLNIVVNERDPLLVWEDLSVQQGESYKYALQAYNSNDLYSNKLICKNGALKADFEHCYLSDAKKQLKIAFNPKVSSFKNNLLETKMETIGSKYPFIFRNGQVHYKEFSISGLLSLLSDPTERFSSLRDATDVELKRFSTPGAGSSKKSGSDLNSENIYNERLFKMEVLEWLNDGQPKIFRSPTEGNFIVRLMNVSLAPNDTLGRMLHTFSCTAYQIADWNFSNLMKYNLVDVPVNKQATLRIGQVSPTEIFESFMSDTLAIEYPDFVVSNDKKTIYFPESYSVNITEAIPGTRFKLLFSGDGISPDEIEIGGTGAYYIPIARKPADVNNIYFQGITNVGDEGDWEGMKITFEQYDNSPTDTFSQISNLNMTEEIRRFIGPGYNINLVAPASAERTGVNNILADIRREIGIFHFIRVEKRFIQDVWPIGDTGKYSRNAALNDIIADNEWNPVVIYHNTSTDKYYSGNMATPISGASPDFRFCLNNKDSDYSDFGGYMTAEVNNTAYGNTFGRMDALRNVENVDTLRVGNGLLLDVAYRVREKEYTVESETEVASYKNSWRQARAALIELLRGKRYTYITFESIPYKKDTYYYYNEDSQSYILSTSDAPRSDRKYFKLDENIIPTEKEIDAQTKIVGNRYRSYVDILTSYLEKSR